MKISMAFRHIVLNMRLILIVIIILSIAKFIKNDTKFKYDVSNSIYFKPLHYNVKVRFDVYRNVFFGKCNIIIEIQRPTKNITIKSSGIFGIIKIDLIYNNDDRTTPRKHPITVNIQTFSFINEMNICLNCTQSSVDFLSPGTYILKMVYVRTILNDEDPFESYDTDKEKVINDEKAKVITAEELFPCWNEPVFKSTFNLSIHHHKSYKFLSNMRIRRTVEMMRNMLWTHFEESPLLSVQHLTIWIINTVKLTKYLGATANVELWCRKEIIDNMQFAESIAQGIVYFLKQKSTKIYTKIHYIVTRDFQHSDIKISGFIQLREEDILYNYTIDHTARKIEVANLIAHQTISYWYDDVFVWSKEGFVTFLATHILNQTQLMYRPMNLFVVQTQQESLRFDTLPDTDSLLLHTLNISAIHSFRSSFHYIKSSIIWRMLYHLISDNVFWTSINTYMNRQCNQSNALQIDELWNIMQATLNNNGNLYNLHIKIIINTWMENQYFQLSVEQNYLNNFTVFRLIINSNFDKNARYSTLVTYMTKSNNYNAFWVNQEVPFLFFEKNFPLLVKSLFTQFDKNDWIMVNLQQVGYYRVNYNTENWENLAHYLYYENVTGIHVLNRAQIIDDAFYFLVRRELDFTMFWNITKFLFKDTDYVAWYPMIKAVEYMTCMWAVQDTTVLKHKIEEMFYKLLLNIGYHKDIYESDFTKYLREEAIKWACVLGKPDCRKIATFELKKDLQSSVQDKHLEWKEWIYCKGLMTANYTTWLDVYKEWQKTNDNILLEYLTCSTNSDINRNYLRLTMEHEFTSRVSNKMCANIILLIIAKHAKNDIVFEFIFERLKFIKFSLKKQVDQIAILIVIITHDHVIDKFEKINEFVKNNLTISDKRLVDAVEQKMEKRIKEYQRQVRNYGSFRLHNHNVQ